MSDGLPANHVSAICQDGKGYVWVGTSDGLGVFDGNNFRTLTTQQGLPSNFISAIVEDRVFPGVMWLLCRQTLVRLGGDTVGTFKQAGVRINSMHQDGSGTMWLATDSGVCRVVDDRIVRWADPIVGTLVYGIGETSDSVLWFVKEQSIVRHSLRTGGLREFGLPLGANHQFWDLQGDGRGNLWIASDRVVLVRDSGVVAWRKLPSASWLTVDRRNNLWFGGYGGIGRIRVDRFVAGEPEFIRQKNGLPDEFVRTIFADREGNLWIGGRDRGLSLLPRESVVRFPAGPVWDGMHHQFAASDGRGRLWLISGNNLQEFWRDADGRWSRHQHELSIVRHPGVDPDIGSLFFDRGGDLWISAVLGPEVAYRFATGPGPGPSTLRLKQTIRYPLPAGESFAMTAITDREGDVWVSLAKKGVLRIDPDDQASAPRLYGDSSGVPSNYVRELFEDRDGNVWATSFDGGVARIARDGRVRRFTAAEGLPDNNCWQLVQDPSGRIVVGTARGGLAEISGDSVRVISMAEGLPSNSVTSLAVDPAGRLWVATSLALLRETAPGARTFVARPELHGPGASVVGVLPGGEVWYFAGGHLAIYDPNSQPRDPVDVPVHISAVRVNGVNAPLSGEFELSYDQSTIEVGYVGLSYGIEGGPSFRYRLVGADERWQGPTNNRSVIFGHLDPGEYRFEVVAVGREGGDSGKPAQVSIIVARPFWLRWWFIAGCCFVLSGSGVAVARVRTAKYRREQQAGEEFSRKLIESQEKERKRLAGELHDEIGQELLVMINRAEMGLRADSLDKARRQLEEVSAAASRAIGEVRNMAFDLRPYHLEQLGLTESLKSMVEKVAGSVPIRFTVTIDPVDGLVEPTDEINVFRIVQECLNNIVKHSAATRAEVVVGRTPAGLGIRVVDDGRGMIRNGARRSIEGFGLTGLTERARLMRGTVTISSDPGNGTVVTVSIPLTDRSTQRSTG